MDDQDDNPSPQEGVTDHTVSPGPCPGSRRRYPHHDTFLAGFCPRAASQLKDQKLLNFPGKEKDATHYFLKSFVLQKKPHMSLFFC